MAARQPRVPRAMKRKNRPSAQQQDTKHSTVTTESPSTDHKNMRHHHLNDDRRRLEHVSLWFEGSIVVFTLALTVVSFYQWRATRESLEIAERAWVTATQFKFADHPRVGEIPRATIDFTNAGNSPAANVKLIRFMTFTNGLYPQPGPELDRLPEIGSAERLSTGVIGPSGAIHTDIALGRAITEDEFKRIQTGASRLYVFGVLEYNDIFGKARRTEFCFLSPDFGTERELSLAVCSHWNRAE
jgi:hypothetical protein